MYCMKCGKEIPEKQVFCDSCLEIMDQFPVKPDTRVLLPNRSASVSVKKPSNRRKTRPSEERLVRARRVIQWLSVALVASVIALCLSITLLIDTIGDNQTDHAIGQNFSTVDALRD